MPEAPLAPEICAEYEPGANVISIAESELAKGQANAPTMLATA